MAWIERRCRERNAARGTRLPAIRPSRRRDHAGRCCSEIAVLDGAVAITPRFARIFPQALARRGIATIDQADESWSSRKRSGRQQHRTRGEDSSSRAGQPHMRLVADDDARPGARGSTRLAKPLGAADDTSTCSARRCSYASGSGSSRDALPAAAGCGSSTGPTSGHMKALIEPGRTAGRTPRNAPRSNASDGQRLLALRNQAVEELNRVARVFGSARAPVGGEQSLAPRLRAIDAGAQWTGASQQCTRWRQPEASVCPGGLVRAPSR